MSLPTLPRLHALPLTAHDFEPFGIVIQAPKTPGRRINGGTSQRFDLVPDLQVQHADGWPMLALFRAQARTFPHLVTEMERHALGTQTFVPLGRRRFVIVVAIAGPAPRPEALVAFVSNGEQGVVLAPGTWHHALLAVDAGDFVVIERAADVVDCEVCDLAATVPVVLA